MGRKKKTDEEKDTRCLIPSVVFKLKEYNEPIVWATYDEWKERLKASEILTEKEKMDIITCVETPSIKPLILCKSLNDKIAQIGEVYFSLRYAYVLIEDEKYKSIKIGFPANVSAPIIDAIFICDEKKTYISYKKSDGMPPALSSLVKFMKDVKEYSKLLEYLLIISASDTETTELKQYFIDKFPQIKEDAELYDALMNNHCILYKQLLALKRMGINSIHINRKELINSIKSIFYQGNHYVNKCIEQNETLEFQDLTTLTVKQASDLRKYGLNENMGQIIKNDLFEFDISIDELLEIYKSFGKNDLIHDKEPVIKKELGVKFETLPEVEERNKLLRHILPENYRNALGFSQKMNIYDAYIKNELWSGSEKSKNIHLRKDKKYQINYNLECHIRTLIMTWVDNHINDILPGWQQTFRQIFSENNIWQFSFTPATKYYNISFYHLKKCFYEGNSSRYYSAFNVHGTGTQSIEMSYKESEIYDVA